MIYEFDVPGKVTGKARPKINTYTMKTYTPVQTKEYENLIKQYFLINYPNYKTLTNRIKVSIIAYFSILKNVSKKNKELMLEDKISPTKKPDIDNIGKIVLDSLNKMAFIDDNQITKLEINKIYGNEEKIHIKIEEY